jgi:hypothetical protein
MNALPLVAAALSVALVTAGCSEAQIPLPPAPAPAVAPMDTSTPPPADISVEVAGICNIEAIGEVTGAALDAPVRVIGASAVSGWRTLLASDGTEASAWLRAVDAGGAVALQLPLPATEDRPDVAEVAKRDSALRSGFRQVAVTGLPPGTYTLQIVLGSGTQWVRCAHARTLAVE